MTRTILFVEDTEDNRRILRDFLSHVGYSVLEAENGEQGVRVARESNPDLILMDIQMPVMDGYEAAAAIKALPQLRHIPIIAITSYALSGDEERARSAGCDAYMAKPFTPRTLLTLIESFFPEGP